MGLLAEAENAEDIRKRIAELAKSYTPEWHFTETDPDIGSVIAMLFAMQTEENLRLVERIPERYRMEFVNMLDISLKAAQPAAGIVLFEPTDNTVAGTMLRRGTRLMADSDLAESGSVVFETDRDLYVTSAAITDAFLTDEARGTLTPLLGEFDDPQVFPEYEGEESGASATAEPEEEVTPAVRPFILFGESETIGQSALLIWHSRYFDDVGEPIYLRFTNSPALIKGIAEGRFTFSYAGEDCVERFREVRVEPDGETVVLIKDGACRRFPVDGDESGRSLAMIALTAAHPLTETILAGDVYLSAGGGEKAPESVNDGTSDLAVDGFAPFSDTLAVYNECYIGQDACFSKAGARVTMTWNTAWRENVIRITAEEEQEELKLIKRKPRRIAQDTPARVSVDEITMEYFNGIGWKRLICETEYTTLFAGQAAGEYRVSFLCPGDWEPTETGSYRGRSIRLRLTRSDNCYLRPAVHSYPYLSRMRINYTYEGRFARPDRMESICGTARRDLNGSHGSDSSFPIMEGFNWREDALWLGLNRRPEDGPVSLYFQLSDVGNQRGVRCRFEYSTPVGFKEMRVMDYTDDFSKPGIVMFLPPPDFSATEIQGKSRYWIRIARLASRKDKEPAAFLPRIARLLLNAVPVTNVQTGEEQDFYVDEVLPNMSFALGGSRLLDARVWVNEKNVLSDTQMSALLAEKPDRVRAEYDLIGRVSAFYVLWDETDSFEGAPSRRCYRIDRMTNRIHFSDGVLCDLPRVTDDIAFKVRIRTTDGAVGNLPADSITSILGSAPFIDRVSNPIRTHGGGDLESVDHALLRGAGIMHSRERLVSTDDYTRFVMEYSDSIERASVVVGRTIEGGGSPADISIVLLMKDYADGSFSFHRIETGLKRRIRERSELALGEDDLHIVEPIFVFISVHVWIQCMDMDESFEVQNDVRQVLNTYLDPIAGEGRDGWAIGTLPKPSQIMMRLGVLKSRAIVRRLNLVASWRDATGEHEADITELAVNPFMVCVSGEHRILTVYD